MATDPTGYAGPHPDLPSLFRDSLQKMHEQAAEHPGSQAGPPGFPAGIQAGDLTVRYQRTWHDISAPGPEMDGCDFSAGVIQFASGRKHYSYFVTAARQSDSPEWSCTGMSGGEQPPGARDRAGGFLLASGAYACVGEMRKTPGRIVALLQRIFGRRAAASIQIEHADGTLYSARFENDGGCIVFAPVVQSVAHDDHVIVRRLDADGNVLSQARVWIGDGGPPPAEMFAAMRS